ncbi:MAG: hypothetical protein NT069_02620 [Planctomycetota bacterium]|nr:hypothetical protein [Planctomycetota bacterium]
MLQLLNALPVKHLAVILEEVCPAGLPGPPILYVDVIISRVARRCADAKRETLVATDLLAGVPVVRVPAPNKPRYNRLLPSGDLRRMGYVSFNRAAAKLLFLSVLGGQYTKRRWILKGMAPMSNSGCDEV